MALNASDSKAIGVLVLSQFFWGADRDFIESACSTDETPHLLVKWYNPDERPEPTMRFFSGTYTWLTPQKFRLTLLGIPPSLRKDFRLSDLELPFDIAGCVLIVDLSEAFPIKAGMVYRDETHLSKKQLEALEQTGDKDVAYALEWMRTDVEERLNIWWMGGIAWIRMNKLPFVVVFIKPKAPAIAENEMRDLLRLEPQNPVIFCASEIGDDKVSISFEREDIEQILLALMEQIEA